MSRSIGVAMVLAPLCGACTPPPPASMTKDPGPKVEDTAPSRTELAPVGCESPPPDLVNYDITPLERISETFDFTADGVVGIDNYVVVVWDTNGARRDIEVGPVGVLRSTATLPDGRVALAAGTSIFLLNTTDEELVELATDFGQPGNLRVSRDGYVLVSDAAEGTIVVLDPSDPATRYRLVAGLDYPTDIALSADEERLYVITERGQKIRAAGRLGPTLLDEWTDSWKIHEHQSVHASGLSAVSVDRCNNLYFGTSQDDGQVYRLAWDGSDALLITVGVGVGSLGWAPDLNVWHEHALYGSVGDGLVELRVGVGGPGHALSQ